MICREGPPFEHPAVHQYQPLQKQLKYLHMLPISHFWLECSGSEVICILNSRTLGIYLKSPMGLSYQRFQIGTFLPSYSIEQGFFFTSCPAWAGPKGFCMIPCLIYSRGYCCLGPNLKLFFQITS